MSLSVLASCILFIQVLAFGKTFPYSLLPFEMGRVLWILTSILFLVFLIRVASQKKISLFDLKKIQPSLLRLWILGNSVYCGLAYLHFHESFQYAFPWIQILASITLAALWGKIPPNKRLGSALVLSVILLMGAIIHFPLHPGRSDMLPVIVDAWSRFTSQLSPYAPTTLLGKPNLMGYLPGTFLSHAPAFFLGIDPRFNQILYRILWGGLLIRHLGKENLLNSNMSIALQLFLLSPQLNYRHELYFEFFFLMLTVFYLFPRLRGISFGIAILTRQWAWVLAPFWILKILRNRSVHSILLQLLGFALSTSVILAVIFSVTAPPDFLHAVFWFQKTLDSAKFPGDYGLSLAPLFYGWDIAGTWGTRLLQPIQMLGVLIFGGLALLTPQNTLKNGALALCFFMLWNGHSWIYFWFSSALVLILTEIVEPTKN